MHARGFTAGQKLWKIRTGPPGRRAAGPPGCQAVGPPGRRAAGPSRAYFKQNPMLIFSSGLTPGRVKAKSEKQKQNRSKIRKRDFLKTKAISSNNPAKWDQFRCARNQANNAIKLANKLYVSDNLEANKGNLRKTWNVINELTYLFYLLFILFYLPH